MKTKINIAVLIVVTSMSLFACVEEEIGPPTNPQATTGIRNTNVPIK